MKIIREIFVYGGIAIAINLLLSYLLKLVFPKDFDLWIFDSLSALIISVILLLLSKFSSLKNHQSFELILRYLFSSFIVMTIYNFVFAVKIFFGFSKFCIVEDITDEQFYQYCFASNFFVFLSTFLFMLIFKRLEVKVFTRNSLIFILLILTLTIVFRTQTIVWQLFNSIF